MDALDALRAWAKHPAYVRHPACTSLSPLQNVMFCVRCQAFWAAVRNIAQIPEKLTSDDAIRWSPFEVILHQTLRQLKSASDQGCSLCAVLWSQPDREDSGWFSKDLDEPIDVTLYFVTSNGARPLISASFNRRAATEDSQTVHITKRTVATFGGLTRDCEHTRFYILGSS